MLYSWASPFLTVEWQYFDHALEVGNTLSLPWELGVGNTLIFDLTLDACWIELERLT